VSQPAHKFASNAHAEARRQFETRKLTQDGAIWPVRRPEMRHGPTIRERMVEDLEACFCRSDIATIIRRLCDVGWTREQVAAHSDRATADFRAAQHDALIPATTVQRDAFALIDEVKPGDFLITDGGFTCLPEGSVREVEADARGNLFIRCAEGEHGLEGQVDNEQGRLIGLFHSRARP
jgi:hypothetical protein